MSDPGHLQHFRVVHVIDSLGRSGGAEQQLVANLRQFVDHRLRHDVLCLYRSASSRETDLPADVEVSYVRKNGRRSRNRLVLILLVFIRLRRMRPDIVHCTLPDASLAARVAGSLLGVPVIESLVNVSHEEVRLVDERLVTRWKLKAHRVLDKWTMRSVVKFHAISHEVARSWIDTVGLPLARIAVVPRGVEVEVRDRAACRRALVDSLSIGEDSFVILNVGRQVPQKGHIYALRAMVKVAAELPQAVFVSAGSEGPMSDVLRREVESLGIEDRVFWLGVREDIAELMAAADVFAFPSLYEGLGVSLLQAMGSGLPCVTSDRPPMTEVVRDEESGLLVPPGDATALADALVRLGRDEGLRLALGREAKAQVGTEFNLPMIAARIEGLYREVLGLA